MTPQAHGRARSAPDAPPATGADAPTTQTLDARGLSCPLPLVLARQRVAKLAPGDKLLVLATDPEAPIDLAAWAAEEGHGFNDRSESVASTGAARSGEPGWLELELRKAG